MEHYEKTLNAFNSLNTRVRAKRALICDHFVYYIYIFYIFFIIYLIFGENLILNGKS